MDIQELRIGDKVTYCNRIVDIRAIHDVGLVEFSDNINGINNDYSVQAQFINPIPLTDGLLCSIGIFPYFRANTETCYSIKDYCLLDYISNMGFYKFTAESGKKNIRIRKNIKYLHQLQHELYDAGIEFKIEL